MKKHRYSLNLDTGTIALIDEAAAKNHTSRSAIARMFLQLIKHVPVNRLQEKSPVPAILGIETKEVRHNASN